jgi:hypothetical protein
MLKPALALAAWALGLEIAVGNVLPPILMFAKYPHSRLDLPNLLANEFLALFPAIALILFFVSLRRELLGKIGFSVRQLYAMVALIGQAVGLAAFLVIRRSGLAPHPVQYWSEFAVFRVFPSFCWIALLWIFWKDAAPLGSRPMRLLAGVLCALKLVTGLRSSYYMVINAEIQSRFEAWSPWEYGIGMAITVLSWVSVALVLLALCREDRPMTGSIESATGS